mgnify:CR=1 FL=1
MLLNRSAPHARVVPVLPVGDVRAAVAWYARAWGFVEHVRIGEGHRAQLGLPGETVAELIVAEVRPGRRVPTADRTHQVMIKVDDVSAAAAHAQQLAADGHDIEAHSITHARAPEYVESQGLAAYLDEDVLPSIDLLRRDGYDVTTFAYPFGSRTDETDGAILDHVSQIRSVAFTWSGVADPCPY